MYFDRDSKPEILCSPPADERPALQWVELTVNPDGKGNLCAVNGVSLIRLQVTGCERDTSGPIPPAAFDVARKLARKAKTSVAEIICERETLRFADGSTMPRPAREEYQAFPDVSQVIPKPPDFRHLDVALFEAEKQNPGPYTVKLGLDPELLLEACKANGLSGIVGIEVTILPPQTEERDACQVHAPLVIRRDGVEIVVMPGRVV